MSRLRRPFAGSSPRTHSVPPPRGVRLRARFVLGPRVRFALRAERGQAAVELVACLPFVALIAMALWQAAVAGQAAWLSGAAARAAARAAAVDRDALAAARGVLPASMDGGVRVRSAAEGAVRVTVPVPLVFGRGALTMLEAEAKFEPQKS